MFSLSNINLTIAEADMQLISSNISSYLLLKVFAYYLYSYKFYERKLNIIFYVDNY